MVAPQSPHLVRTELEQFHFDLDALVEETPTHYKDTEAVNSFRDATRERRLHLKHTAEKVLNLNFRYEVVRSQERVKEKLLRQALREAS